MFSIVKKTRYFSILVIIIFVVWNTEAGFGCELKAGYEEEKPFHFSNEEGDVIGTDADILREALESVGCKLEFKERPWQRTLRGVKDGDLDIAIGAKYLDERAEFAYYSVPYKSIQHWLYTRAGEYMDVDSIESLLKGGKTKLGVMRGWGYPPGIASVLKDTTYSDSIIAVDLFEQLPKMLDRGRLDGIIATPESLKIEVAQKTFTHQFVSKARYEEQLHFLFSKKSVSPEIVVDFNAALLKLTHSGQQRQIFIKYGLIE